MSATFAMVCCQQEAETAVKREVSPSWRLAFSRPGFITFKYQDTYESNLPTGVFVRYSGWSIGKVVEDKLEVAVEKLKDLLAGETFVQIHVWARDRAQVGRFDFEPGSTVLSQSVADEIFPALSTARIVTGPKPNHTAEPGQRVLDVVLVEPGEWWIGWHTAVEGDPATSWPGGTPKLVPPANMVSRTYLKTAEGLAWAEFPMKSGDVAVEIGSAPGGSVQRLLELGLRVVGIDPADMDPVVAEHPNFMHMRARGGDLKRRAYRDARWLVVDSNVPPEKSLTTVQNIVTHRDVRIRGLLVTLKLSSYDMALQIPEWVSSIKQWGYSDVRVRQLAFGKQEVCVAARLRSRMPSHNHT